MAPTERARQCEAAINGTLDRAAELAADAGHRAYLLSCALMVVVGEVDEGAEAGLKLNVAKQALADRLLSSGVDVTYRNADQMTLLMLVIISYLPKPWKLDAAQRLIERGCDVTAKNAYGKSALELATFKRSDAIVALLRDHGAARD